MGDMGIDGQKLVGVWWTQPASSVRNYLVQTNHNRLLIGLILQHLMILEFHKNAMNENAKQLFSRIQLDIPRLHIATEGVRGFSTTEPQEDRPLNRWPR